MVLHKEDRLVRADVSRQAYANFESLLFEFSEFCQTHGIKMPRQAGPLCQVCPGALCRIMRGVCRVHTSPVLRLPPVLKKSLAVQVQQPNNHW